MLVQQILDYFQKIVLKINLNDFNGSIDAIKECISNKYYEENYDELLQQKILSWKNLI